MMIIFDDGDDDVGDDYNGKEVKRGEETRL